MGAKGSQFDTQVREILWQDWDPIGVRDDAPLDEYDTYLFKVIGMVRTHATASEIAGYLTRVEADVMGLEADPERAHRVAAKLMRLWSPEN